MKAESVRARAIIFTLIALFTAIPAYHLAYGNTELVIPSSIKKLIAFSAVYYLVGLFHMMLPELKKILYVSVPALVVATFFIIKTETIKFIASMAADMNITFDFIGQYGIFDTAILLIVNIFLASLIFIFVLFIVAILISPVISTTLIITPDKVKQ